MNPGAFLPVHRNDDASPKEVWIIFDEFLRNFLKHVQKPDLVVNGSIQLICLQDKKSGFHPLMWIF